MLSLQNKSLQQNRNLPINKRLTFLLIGLFIIGMVFATIMNSLSQNEERLQVLDAKYRDGQELSENEFKVYCDLLEKIWKKHLSVCYCKDGIENPIPETPLRSEGSA